MSPLLVKMLLHYATHARDYRDEVPKEHAESTAVQGGIRCLLSNDLIFEKNKDWKNQNSSRWSQYGATEKGRAMVDAICEIQIPICKWVQP